MDNIFVLSPLSIFSFFPLFSFHFSIFSGRHFFHSCSPPHQTELLRRLIRLDGLMGPLCDFCEGLSAYGQNLVILPIMNISRLNDLCSGSPSGPSLSSRGALETKRGGGVFWVRPAEWSDPQSIKWGYEFIVTAEMILGWYLQLFEFIFGYGILYKCTCVLQ